MGFSENAESAESAENAESAGISAISGEIIMGDSALSREGF